MNKIICSSIFLAFIIFPLKAYTQSSISIGGQAGLATTDGDLGRLLYISSDIAFDEKYGMELGFSYLKIEESNGNSYITHRYSILAEHYINSDDKRFQISGKMGPSILSYHNAEDYKSTLGLDVGLDTSYSIFGPVSINFGFINNVNKNTNLIVQIYLGFSYNFNFQNKVVAIE